MNPGDRVRYGFRTGQILRLERKYGQDGAVVDSDVLHPGDGSYPGWVPLSGLTVLPPEPAPAPVQ